MRPLLALIMLLVSTTAYSQIVVKDEYFQYEPVEIKFQTTPNAKVVSEIKPLSGQTKWSSRNYGDITALWGEPGRYEVSATVITVDFDNRTFDVDRWHNVFIILGSGPPGPPEPPGPEPPGPQPPEPPQPTVPTDIFNNIGRRIDAKADELNLQYDMRLRISELFEEVVKKMQPSGGIVQTDQARNWLQQQYNKLSLGSSWKELNNMITLAGNEWASTQGFSWEEVQAFYLAVAAGYKGGPL